MLTTLGKDFRTRGGHHHCGRQRQRGHPSAW
jgi:hypothetical protein